MGGSGVCYLDPGRKGSEPGLPRAGSGRDAGSFDSLAHHVRVSPAGYEAPRVPTPPPAAPPSPLPKLFQVSAGLCRALLPPDVEVDLFAGKK